MWIGGNWCWMLLSSLGRALSCSWLLKTGYLLEIGWLHGVGMVVSVFCRSRAECRDHFFQSVWKQVNWFCLGRSVACDWLELMQWGCSQLVSKKFAVRVGKLVVQPQYITFGGLEIRYHIRALDFGVTSWRISWMMWDRAWGFSSF